jgi:RNA polymerase sigma-70 factor (ECF subfamily)
LTASTSDDLLAIHRLKRGDIGGLEVLIARYQVKAIRAAFLIVHDEALAEDIVQDTFIRFYQSAGHFDELRRFEPYFMRGVVNASLNALEKESRVVALGSDDSSVIEPMLDRAASVETQVEALQLKQQILSYLSDLPPRQRVAIVQRYYLEMSEQEMADALDAAPGTIKWLLHSARTRLRSLLSSAGGAE